MSDDVESNDPVTPEEDVTEVLDERSDVERQRDEYLDALQRLQADFENYRKRVVRSAGESATRAAGDLVVTLLPVLDSFDYAQAHFGDATSSEAEALNQARGLMLETLKREGLERLDAVGVDFDPRVHDAVAHVSVDESDESDGHVVDEVLRAGYLWKGVVLRPAMVRVRG